MNNEKKKFIAPEADIVDFVDDDIITLSGDTDGEWWTSGSDGENW